MLKKTYFILFLLLVFGFNFFLQAQALSPNLSFGCDTYESSLPSTPFGMGLSKPMKTLPTTDGGIQFRVLMVFVEFNDESASSPHWTINSLPDYSDELFAPEKDFGLNAYEDYIISDYYNKLSNDQFDVIGDVYHVVIGKQSDYSSLADAEVDVYDYLDNTLGINWGLYDQWRWNNGLQEYEFFADGYIDMAYIQYRSVDPYSITWGGYGSNMTNYLTRDNRHLTTEAISYTGTGVTGVDGANLTKLDILGLFRHEYAHYTLGNHVPYSTIGGGDGSSSIFGYELALSPQDLLTVGLANATTYSGALHSFNIEDMATTGEMLKVPTTNSGEYFLVSNRQRVAGSGPYTWDCNMGGDTAMGEPFGQYHDYSKGLYIYHITSGNNFEAWADLECADGLWDWTQSETSTPDWSNVQTLPVMVKTAIGRNEDNPTSGYYYDASRLTSRDGMSVVSQTSNPYAGWGQKWFGIGQRHTCINMTSCRKGTDRSFTNLEEIWTAREHQGDRWDAWARGYNEVFSPYSSPNTKARNGAQTGLFIYYSDLSSGVATIEVYQGDANTNNEEDALLATPPSKPMLYRPVTIYNCNGLYGHPRITWDNNLEPDMVRGSDPSYKRYKIYRAISDSFPIAPLNYTYLATYDDYTPEDTANFIDNNALNGVLLYCRDISNNDTYFRYKITAVDNTDWESVPSDFVSIKADQSTPDRPGVNTESEAPVKFSLSQNYPNPFNPTTEIKFELPKDNFVTVKIYNALGEEVAALINNEWKTTGRYSVKFDGSNLASGIYFYTITAGMFRDTKKMVLIK